MCGMSGVLALAGISSTTGTIEVGKIFDVEKKSKGSNCNAWLNPSLFFFGLGGSYLQ